MIQLLENDQNAANVIQVGRANAATFGVTQSHRRHVSQFNRTVGRKTTRKCTSDQSMLQRESQRPFVQQQRPKEEERTSKGQRIIRANHQACHIKVLSLISQILLSLFRLIQILLLHSGPRPNELIGTCVG